jgi:hypothetical protein
MLARAPLLTTATLLAACDGPASTPPGDGGRPADAQALASTGLFLPTDGKRLKARWHQAPDGQRSFAGWHDTQLKTDCFVSRAYDGELRCLPSALAVEDDFSDAGCVTPVAVNTSDRCETFQYARRRDTSNPCQARWRIYRLGEKLDTKEVFWNPFGNSCEPGGITENAAAYSVGDELPVTMFLRIQLKPEQPRNADDPVQLVVLEGEDGSRGDGGWQLASTMSDCWMDTLEDGQLRCIPVWATTSSVYGDASCTQSLVGVRAACDDAPAFARDWPEGACMWKPALHQLGARVETLFRVRSADNMCAATSHPVGVAYYLLGDQVPDDTFPAFQVVVDPGPQPLRRRRLVAPNGRASGDDWHDATRDEPCFATFLDGKLRCAPSSEFFDYHFADEQCTQPLYWESELFCTPPYLRAVVDQSTCPRQAVLYSVGEAYTGPVYTLTTNRNITPAEFDCSEYPALPSQKFRRLNEIPATELTEMKAVEP